MVIFAEEGNYPIPIRNRFLGRPLGTTLETTIRQLNKPSYTIAHCGANRFCSWEVKGRLARRENGSLSDPPVPLTKT